MRIADGSTKNDEVSDVERDNVFAESPEDMPGIDTGVSVESGAGNEDDNGGNEGTEKDISSDVLKEGKGKQLLETCCVTGECTFLFNYFTVLSCFVHFLIVLPIIKSSEEMNEEIEVEKTCALQEKIMDFMESSKNSPTGGQ